MKGLTKRQQEVLAFIQYFINTNNYSPSYREIMNHFGFSSLGTVSKHIDALIRKGALSAEKQCSRSLMPTHPTTQTPSQPEVELPFIGHVSTDAHVETFPQVQTLAVPEFLVHSPESSYVLRARGDTLNDEMIADGDLLVIEARNEAFDGETVVATTPDAHTIIKRYHPEGNYIRLTSPSPHIEPLIIRYDDLVIHGILASLLRMHN